MSRTSSMRVVETDAAGAGAEGPVAEIDGQIQQMQTEIESLQREVNALRRRDETINFHMHRVDEELRLAARLQQDFLPKSLPQVGQVHFHTLFRPASYVSGDLYDVMRLDESHVGFYMADAVGHGMPAALLTMFIKNALQTKEILGQGYRLLDPSESMERLNATLVDQQLANATFATAIYGTVDTSSLTVRFARGGHPIPILMRADGTIETLECDGSLLGIFPGEKFPVAQRQLRTGDRVFVYSDGIEVAFEGDAVGTGERWRQELEKRRHLSAEQLLIDFCEHLDREVGSLQPKDDLTMIIIEVR